MLNTELNELINAGANLVCEKKKKISVTLKTTNRNSKHGWEIRLETYKKSTRTSKIIRQRRTREYVGTKREKQHNEKTQYSSWR